MTPLAASRPTARLAVLVLVGLSVAIAAACFNQPLGFDESYNLQIVGHLLHEHRYATDGVSLQPGESSAFDYRITTGPTVMLPVAAAAAILGEHVWVYRLVPLVFFVLLETAWFRAGRALGGYWAGVAGVAAVLAVNTAAATWGSSTLLSPGDVLGEIAATALVLLACTALQRPGLAGLLLGLAVLAKTIALLAVPAVGVAVLWAAARRDGRTVSTILRFGALLLAPLVLWQVVRFAALGQEQAQETNRAFVSFMLAGGSGLGPQTASATPLDKLSSQAALLSLSGVLAGLLLLLSLVLGLLMLVRVRRSREAPPGNQSGPVLAAAAAGLTIELWWLLLAEHDWVRHSLIGVLLLVPALCVAAAARLADTSLRGRRPLAGALAVALAAAAAAHVVENYSLPSADLDDQQRVATWLRERPEGYHFAGQNLLADLMLLGAGTPEPLDEDGGLVVLRQRDDVTANVLFDEQLAACGRVVFEAGGFTACEVPPGPVPASLVAIRG